MTLTISNIFSRDSYELKIPGKYSNKQYNALNTLHKKIYDKSHLPDNPLDYEKVKLPLKSIIEQLSDYEKQLFVFLLINVTGYKMYEELSNEIKKGHIQLPEYNPNILDTPCLTAKDDINEKLIKLLGTPQSDGIPTFLKKVFSRDSYELKIPGEYSNRQYNALNTLHKKIYDRSHLPDTPFDYEKVKLPLKSIVEQLSDHEKQLFVFLLVNVTGYKMYEKFSNEIKKGHIQLPEYNPSILDTF